MIDGDNWWGCVGEGCGDFLSTQTPNLKISHVFFAHHFDQRQQELQRMKWSIYIYSLMSERLSSKLVSTHR